MDIEALLQFVKKESDRLAENYGTSQDNVKRVLSRTVKLQEEVGELSDAILSSVSFQRKEKLDKFNKEDLAEELSDVLICTLLLAEASGVDIRESLSKKMDKINNREY
ncbi:MAG: MazG nucleotide pyrophosphohydrolase domain-containing protein [Candidatus Paceibacterota bacterium]|jgi:NTP pyrophosphatase (non-canonical NTP hydrolase)